MSTCLNCGRQGVIYDHNLCYSCLRDRKHLIKLLAEYADPDLHTLTWDKIAERLMDAGFHRCRDRYMQRYTTEARRSAK